LRGTPPLDRLLDLILHSPHDFLVEFSP